MKLYYSKGACSLAPRIVINELNIPCEFEAVNIKTKKTETEEDFLKISSKGAVPVLKLDNNEILTENTAILQFLADKNEAFHLLPKVNNFARYRVLEWLSFISSDLHKTFGPLFKPKLPDTTREQFIELLKHKFSFVNDKLKNSSYLVDDNFTIADAYFFVMIFWLKHFNLEVSNWPNIAQYFLKLKERPSVLLALQDEGFI